jgi:hypothetical protein
MKQRLSMAANKLDLTCKSFLGGAHRFCVELAQEKIQTGKVAHAGVVGVHTGQYCPSDLAGVGILGMSEQFEPGIANWFLS